MRMGVMRMRECVCCENKWGGCEERMRGNVRQTGENLFASVVKHALYCTLIEREFGCVHDPYDFLSQSIRIIAFPFD